MFSIITEGNKPNSLSSDLNGFLSKTALICILFMGMRATHANGAETPSDLDAAIRAALNESSYEAVWQTNDGSPARDFGDFELYVDWKILAKVDSGIYLRGTPQVQIWDTANPSADVGSGGLYNNQKNPSKPSVKADNPVGEWNTFYIKMVGEKVTVKLNGTLVVDNVVMENYWERDKSIYPTGSIELQNHGNTLYFMNIHVREIARKQ